MATDESRKHDEKKNGGSTIFEDTRTAIRERKKARRGTDAEGSGNSGGSTIFEETLGDLRE